MKTLERLSVFLDSLMPTARCCPPTRSSIMGEPAMKTFRKLFVFAGILGILALVAAPVQADWDPSMPTKWVQHPDLETGMDVNATYLESAAGPTSVWPFVKILADDFPCTTTGPITDIHIWGSWLHDRINDNTTFKLSIHDDVPATDTHYSHPGEERWSHFFDPGSYVARPVPSGTATEMFYEPNTDEIIGYDTQVWQYNFLIPESEAFVQEGSSTNKKVYWLDVQAIVPADPGIVPEVFGWKTSREHWNDDATYADNESPGGPVISEWMELRYPSGSQYPGESIDLAFAITTVPEPSSCMLLVMASLGLVAYAWRRRRG